MSEANIDVVRAIYAAWERGDHRAAKWADPEIECVFADGPYPARWTGLARTDEGMRSFLSAWEEYRIEVDEFRELDADCVLALVRHRGRRKTSGLQAEHMERDAANLFHFRAGKVTRLVIYFDREHALAELGLLPERESPNS
jgi:ketosteroid isomerase-like protein